MIFNRSRSVLSLFTIATFLSAQALPLLGQVSGIWPELIPAAQAAGAVMTRKEYEACQARDETGFRAAVAAITSRSLRNGLMNVNYDAAVEDAWRRRNVSKVIEAQVDKAVKDVRNESSWGQLLKSLASKSKARELATTVATRVYRSDKVKKAIEMLAGDVGTAIGRRIELATVDAAGPAKKCMQAFLGNRFGTTIAGVVSTNASGQLEVNATRNRAHVTTGKIILESTGGLAGAMVLIVRRQMAKIAARVGQRVLGAVLSRLVSVVAGGVGIVLIAKDIWDMRHGVLPIISAEMKSPETMRKVRQELSREIKAQISANVDDLATKSADRVVQIWLEFRQAHTKVLDLAERHADFKKFLNNISPRHMARLDETVALVLAGEGEKGVLQRLEDGTLDQAVKRLPDEAIQIARDTGGLKKAFAWAALAGDKLKLVAKYDIHRRAEPKEFTRAGLNKILALNDGLAISRLVGIKRAARQALFELDGKDLTNLARALSEEQLAALSGYLTGLQRPAAQQLLFAVTANPSKMNMLAKTRIRNAVMSSSDQLAAVNMMVRGDNVFDIMTFFDDMTLLRHLKVSPWLVWERYPMSLAGLALVALLLVLILWRLLFGRRPKVIVQMPPGHPDRNTPDTSGGQA